MKPPILAIDVGNSSIKWGLFNQGILVGNQRLDLKETISWEDGNEYPLVKLDISHKSHPFFTGIAQFVDTAGRIDKFKNRYGRHMK